MCSLCHVHVHTTHVQVKCEIVRAQSAAGKIYADFRFDVDRMGKKKTNLREWIRIIVGRILKCIFRVLQAKCGPYILKFHKMIDNRSNFSLWTWFKYKYCWVPKPFMRPSMHLQHLQQHDILFYYFTFPNIKHIDVDRNFMCYEQLQYKY